MFDHEVLSSVIYQHILYQNDRNKAKIIVIEMIIKFCPILSKWYRNFRQPGILLSMDNGKLKSMEKEKLKKKKGGWKMQWKKIFPFCNFAKGPWQELLL